MDPRPPASPPATATTPNAFPERDWTASITAQRPPRAAVDPFKPNGWFLEQERSASGQVVNSACILLTNKECPWRCLMCDLWKHTLTGPTPVGATPSQIDFAIERLGCRPRQVKLYNSGSFFDTAAIPVVDYVAIAQRISFAEHVIVESHPRLVGEKALRFRDLLSGSLEVAMGLETVQPEVLRRLNKRFDLQDFAHSADFLRREGIAMRAFVLVKPPFTADAEAVHWAVKSADFAFSCGVSVVSLIPTRPGNGALEVLMKSGEFSPPRIATLEEALEGALKLRRGRVFADTWNLEAFSSCPACLKARTQRLHQINLGQQFLPHVVCPCNTDGEGE